MINGINKQTLMQFVFIAFIIIILYFFSIRPQRKKYNDQKSFLEKLKPGMNIVTVGGIHGTILSVDDKTITIELNGRGTNMVIEKNAISVESSNRLQNTK
ncbi:MAG: preprotein translocase subunit YajC [Bacteroidetes bacterium]|nr:preprotein translocase subunit YajC [Bacteroidota bacterium]